MKFWGKMSELKTFLQQIWQKSRDRWRNSSLQPKRFALSPSDNLINGPCTLKVDYIEQDLDYWCWAACVAMVLKAYQVPGSTPCQVASSEPSLSGLDCCDPADRPRCNKKLKDARITKLWDAFRIPAEPIRDQVSPEKLVEEISQKHNPVQVGFGYNHVAIVYGYQKHRGNLNFLVHDPANYETRITCASELAESPYRRRWDATWVNLAKPPGGVAIDCISQSFLAHLHLTDRVSSVEDTQPPERLSETLMHTTEEGALTKDELQTIGNQAVELMPYLYAGSSQKPKTIALGTSFPMWALELGNLPLEDALDAIQTLPVQTRFWHHQILIDGEVRAYASSHRDNLDKPIVCELSVGPEFGPQIAIAIEKALVELSNKGLDSRSARLLAFLPDYIHTLWLARSNKVYLLNAPSSLVPPGSDKLFDLDEFLHLIH